MFCRNLAYDKKDNEASEAEGIDSNYSNIFTG